MIRCMNGATTLRITTPNAECCFAECCVFYCYVARRYVECRYADCGGADRINWYQRPLLKQWNCKPCSKQKHYQMWRPVACTIKVLGSEFIIIIKVWLYGQCYKTMNCDCKVCSQPFLVSAITLVSDATVWRSLSDDTRVVIYDRNMLKIQATR